MKKSLGKLLPFAMILLTNSCMQDHYVSGDYTRVAKIDAHFHYNADLQAVEAVAKEDHFSYLCINTDVPGEIDIFRQQALAAAFHKRQPGMANYLTTFSMDGWDSANWAEKTIQKLKADFANGAVGVKIWKNVGMVFQDKSGKFVFVDDPRFDPVIDFIMQQGKPILGHLGEPKNCWLPLDKMTVNNDRSYYSRHPEYHMYLHPEYPSYEAQIRARDHFLERHPQLRFIGAHLGSLEWSVDELALRLDKFPNFAVDLTSRICHLQLQSLTDYEKIRQFFIKYQDRILYGTDREVDAKSQPDQFREITHKTWFTDWKYFVTDEIMTNANVPGPFKGLKLPRSVVNKIFHDNAVKWYGLQEGKP
ncbi:MAG: amidohydrolase [Marinilabiliales bacterium]|nr:amidohydrolase [Marinilabiliales bacterium]